MLANAATIDLNQMRVCVYMPVASKRTELTIEHQRFLLFSPLLFHLF